MKVKNISEGPRGINTKTGPVLLDPGQEVDVDLVDAEHKIAAATGWFEMEGAPAADGKPSERDELKAQADELGLQYAGNISNAKLREMIDAKLAEPPAAE